MMIDATHQDGASFLGGMHFFAGFNLVARLNPARWEATGFPLQGGTLQGLPLQRGGLRGGCGACILCVINIRRIISCHGAVLVP